jgi:hypothetical protein
MASCAVRAGVMFCVRHPVELWGGRDMLMATCSTRAEMSLTEVGIQAWGARYAGSIQVCGGSGHQGLSVTMSTCGCLWPSVPITDCDNDDLLLFD